MNKLIDEYRARVEATKSVEELGAIYKEEYVEKSALEARLAELATMIETYEAERLELSKDLSYPYRTGDWRYKYADRMFSLMEP